MTDIQYDVKPWLNKRYKNGFLTKEWINVISNIEQIEDAYLKKSKGIKRELDITRIINEIKETYRISKETEEELIVRIKIIHDLPFPYEEEEST